jgi:hypothetical protein
MSATTAAMKARRTAPLKDQRMTYDLFNRMEIKKVT